MRFDARFLPDFLEAFLLGALPLVEALGLEVFAVEGRLLLFATTRFLAEAALVFLLAAFFVLFLALRELVDFLEADRPLLDFFFAADFLPAFFVAILPSNDPAQYVYFLTGKTAR